MSTIRSPPLRLKQPFYGHLPLRRHASDLYRLLDEGYEPHNVKKLYLHGAKKPDVWVDPVRLST